MGSISGLSVSGRVGGKRSGIYDSWLRGTSQGGKITLGLAEPGGASSC